MGNNSSRMTDSEDESKGMSSRSSTNTARGRDPGTDSNRSSQAGGDIGVAIGLVAVGAYGIYKFFSSGEPTVPAGTTDDVHSDHISNQDQDSDQISNQDSDSDQILNQDSYSGPIGNLDSRPFDLNSDTRDFHDNHARRINFRSQESYKAFRRVIDDITDALKGQGHMSRREYVGSTWEYTSIAGSSDLDVLLVDRDSKNQVQVCTDGYVPGGYAHLQQDGITIEPRAKINKTKSVLQKIINTKDFSGYDVYGVKIIEHGPAVQLDMSYGGDKASIDLVPTLEKKDDRMFVARSPKPDQDGSDRSWRISHSLDAKVKLRSADSGNDCRREVYRVCKVIRDSEPNLHHITSYKLKCTLFTVMDSGYLDWSRGKIGDRLIDVIKELHDAYERGYLPDYFEPDINLIASTSHVTASDTVYRLKKFIKNPEKMFKQASKSR